MLFKQIFHLKLSLKKLLKNITKTYYTRKIYFKISYNKRALKPTNQGIEREREREREKGRESERERIEKDKWKAHVEEKLDSWFVSGKLKMNSAPYALFNGRRRMMRVFLSIPMLFC